MHTHSVTSVAAATTTSSPTKSMEVWNTPLRALPPAAAQGAGVRTWLLRCAPTSYMDQPNDELGEGDNAHLPIAVGSPWV